MLMFYRSKKKEKKKKKHDATIIVVSVYLSWAPDTFNNLVFFLLLSICIIVTTNICALLNQKLEAAD